ncbi:hypothetical protein [Plastoroseomonas hellenica]|uniref:hypothetical protein n=1 Tax=Plastoroseomonas hellenica TaxID=2687306 RepID=UPI001BAA25B3|nr:hypothetical protein [Plastoroseomonas hellenica]MBR0643716.1 cycloisomerase [Plastoroseomonas hellenica]
MQRRTLLALGGLALAGSASAQAPAPATPRHRFIEIARFPSPFARQGIAVDQGFIYPVTDRGIAKLDKATGREVARWEGPRDGPVIHLDGGICLDGRLYGAHSNYPQEPMTSSIEIFDTSDLSHVGTHSFGIQLGSLTWLDRHADAWWAVFANYSRVFGASQRPYGHTWWTTLVKLDDRFRQEQAWVFPQAVLRRAEPMSVSGGSWGPDGLLWCTGHDHTEVYRLRLPRAGSVLELVETVPMPGEGQGIAWDRSSPGNFWCISRSKAEAIGLRLELG